MNNYNLDGKLFPYFEFKKMKKKMDPPNENELIYGFDHIVSQREHRRAKRIELPSGEELKENEKGDMCKSIKTALKRASSASISKSSYLTMPLEGKSRNKNKEFLSEKKNSEFNKVADTKSFHTTFMDRFKGGNIPKESTLKKKSLITEYCELNGFFKNINFKKKKSSVRKLSQIQKVNIRKLKRDIAISKKKFYMKDKPGDPGRLARKGSRRVSIASSKGKYQNSSDIKERDDWEERSSAIAVSSCLNSVISPQELSLKKLLKKESPRIRSASQPDMNFILSKSKKIKARKKFKFLKGDEMKKRKAKSIRMKHINEWKPYRFKANANYLMDE